MSHSSILDFDALLAPISEESPCGTAKETGSDIALLNAFSTITMTVQTAKRIEARRQELESLSPEQRQQFMEGYEGMSDGPNADPKWNNVVDNAITVLSQHSKDTRVLLYLAEGISRTEGLVGLRDALQLSRLMLDRYGDQLFPTPDSPEEANYHLQFVARINESANILSALERTPFSLHDPQLHYYAHLQAIALERMSPEDQEVAMRGGEAGLIDFSKALSHAGDAALKDFAEQIKETLAEAEQLDTTLGELSGKQYLGIGNVVDALKKLQRWYAALIEPFLTTESDSPIDDENATHNGMAISVNDEASHGGFTSGNIAANLQTREQALNSLLKVADFFRKTEPHSPLSYALEQAVRWGRMPLPELLRDLVSDASVLEAVYRRMGIQENGDKS